jgi:hypothetical protein
MNEKLPKPVHASYLKHRRDTAWKIIFPVVLSSVLCLGLIVLINIATFRGGGDAQRWADISTMWIAIPVMLLLLVTFAVLSGIVYLLAKLLKIAPPYTALAQDFFYKMEGYVRRGADAAAKPFIFIDSLGASIDRFLGRRP